MRRVCNRAIAVLAVGLASPALAAEMGSAPVSTGLFATLDGGYLDLDQDDVFGHAVNPSGVAGAPVDDVRISPEDGWFIGGSAGYRSNAPLISFLPFNRWEAYLTYSESDEEERDSVSGAASIDLNNVDATTLATIGGTGSTGIERRTWEFGTRSAVDTGAPGRSSVTWVMQSFTRYSEEETESFAVGTADRASRSADVETTSTGMMLLAEPEHWLSPSLALVGRAGVGVYYYDIEGEFRSSSSAVPDVFAARISDDDDGFGFRAQLGAGVKLRLGAASTLTGYAEADYLSDVGTAGLPDNNLATVTPAEVDTSDAWEFRAGARLSVGLGSGQ